MHIGVKEQLTKTRKIKPNRLRSYSQVEPYLYLLPALSIMLFFVFMPLIQVFLNSFKDYNMFTEPKWIGLDNYIAMFTDKQFFVAFKNTILYFLIVVPVLIVLPLFMAILTNKKMPFIKFFRASYYLPVITSMVIAAIAWNWIYTDKGLLNYFLVDILHVIAKPIAWTKTSKTALYSVMVVTIWKGLGYYMVIYLAGLQGIAKDIWEAAALDGATGLKKHLYLTIPLSAPFMSVVAVMSSIAAMKVFEEIYVMTKGGPAGNSQTLVYYIYETAFDKLNMGYASAIGVILFIILLGFSMLSDYISKREG